jgi:MFS family permease
MDAMIYALVLTPALQDLLRASSVASVGVESIGWYGGVIFSIFLLGWAVGGVLFGWCADRFGRRIILIVTLLLITGSTGLAALSGHWWELAGLRFLTGMGIGGQWAAGAALVAEMWPDEKRAGAGSFLQSAWGVGFFLAAAVNLAVKDFGWRGLFAAGLLPVGSVPVIWLWITDSPRWILARCRAAEAGHHPNIEIRELFGGELRRSTLIGSGLAFVAVFGIWGATNWTPSLVHALPDVGSLEPANAAELVSYAIMALNAGALVGYLSVGPLAERLGRRPTFAVMCAGALLIIPLTCLAPTAYVQVVLLLPVLGFFSKGIFAGFPIYLPELYPTRLRATGAGFCYNAGRTIASPSPLLTGTLVAALGGFGRAAAAIALVYLLGLLILPFAPETKGRPLPE